MNTRFSNELMRQFLVKGGVALPMRGGSGRVLFSRLQVRRLIGSCLDIFKRVRILEVQVYENVGKSLIQVFFKRAFN